MRTTGTIPTPQSIDWGNYAQASITDKRKAHAQTVGNYWLARAKKTLASDGRVVGILDWEDARGGMTCDPGGYCEFVFNGNQMLDAIMAMGDAGWEIQPEHRRFLRVFAVFRGITIREAPSGYHADRSFHERWIQKLPHVGNICWA